MQNRWIDILTRFPHQTDFAQFKGHCPILGLSDRQPAGALPLPLGIRTQGPHKERMPCSLRDQSAPNSGHPIPLPQLDLLLRCFYVARRPDAKALHRDRQDTLDLFQIATL